MGGPLENKAKGTLRKLISINVKKLKVDSEFEAEASIKLLEFLLDLANQGSPLVGQLSNPTPLFAGSCNFVLKCSGLLNDQELSDKLSQIYSKSMDDFFNRNHCVLPLSFFLLPINASWTRILDFAPQKLIQSGFEDSKTRQFRKTQALSLLSALLSNQILRKKKGISKAISACGQKIQNEFKNIVEKDDEAIKPRYLCELLNLTKILYSNTSGSQEPSLVDRESIKPHLEAFRQKIPKNRHFQDVKRAFNKICVVLKIKVIQGSEKKSDKKNKKMSGANQGGFFNDLMDVEPSIGKPSRQNEAESRISAPLTNGSKDDIKKNKKKKKKNKGSKEALKNRKERKEHSIKGQFEGMEMPSFSGISLTDNMNFSMGTSNLENGSTKQKGTDSPTKPNLENASKKRKSADSPTKPKKKKRRQKQNYNIF